MGIAYGTGRKLHTDPEGITSPGRSPYLPRTINVPSPSAPTSSISVRLPAVGSYRISPIGISFLGRSAVGDEGGCAPVIRGRCWVKTTVGYTGAATRSSAHDAAAV
ncbi:hypothetical protein Bbelb_300600 [Branchiostoma belcheri]|nr:hypothetical protein Bbelb_300600 [Branchiostoma belcheri]